MFGITQAGEQTSVPDSPERSDTVDSEFLNDRICQQFGGEFSDPMRQRLLPRCGRGPGLRGSTAAAGIGCGNGARLRIGELDLEPLALPDGDDFGEPEPVARARDGLALRIVDLGLEHDVHHYLGHAAQRTRIWHLTGPEERRVLSQRKRKTDDRPLTCQRADLNRQGVARGRQCRRASCLPIPTW